LPNDAAAASALEVLGDRADQIQPLYALNAFRLETLARWLRLNIAYFPG
jgi:hypothetical protein